MGFNMLLSYFSRQRILYPTLFIAIIAVTPSLGSNLVYKRANSSSLEVSNAVALALTYAYPLALYIQTFYNSTVSHGANTINRGNATSTASEPILVRPNADYVYSPVAIDLSHSDVEIVLPNIINNRSYVFPFYDLYGNNFANLGSVASSPPGKYLLRYDEACKSGLAMVHERFPSYQGVITSPTTWGSLMIRIVTLNNSTDLDSVLEIERHIFVKPIPRPGRSNGPPLTPSALSGSTILSAAALKAPWSLNSTEATALLSLLAILHPFNPPENHSSKPALSSLFHLAGIGNNTYTPPSQLNLTLANLLILQNISRTLSIPSNFLSLGNNWTDYIPSLSGNFGTNFGIRAHTAYNGYLQLVASQAVYPEYISPQSNSTVFSITPSSSIILRFSGPPKAAFWSLTMYQDDYLVPNSLDRYSLHTGSLITVLEGGAFEILLQCADVEPPANWTGNWLPAPEGGGNASVNLRAYGPDKGLEDGGYVWPVVTRVGPKV